MNGPGLPSLDAYSRRAVRAATDGRAVGTMSQFAQRGRRCVRCGRGECWGAPGPNRLIGPEGPGTLQKGRRTCPASS